MKAMIENCCGIDVHQKFIVCCILSGPLNENEPKKYIQTFGTTTKQLRIALSWILEHQVTNVFCESTGQLWTPIFNIFSEAPIQLGLAHPGHIKNVPGRKTDMKDAEWIAQLGRCGLIETSYIPDEEVVQLRLLTRREVSYKQRLTQVKNEVHDLLQRGNIKLTSVISKVFTVTGLKILRLLSNGEVIDQERLAECMQRNLKASSEQFLEALDGKLSLEDRFLLGQSLNEYDFLVQTIEDLENEIEHYIHVQFEEEYNLLKTLPGVSKKVAAIILAEIGPNVDAFESDAHLASWAGLCPGSYQSADKKKPAHTTHGNRYLKRGLILAGVNSKDDPNFQSLFARVSSRGGKMKANVACAHKLLRIIYAILSTKKPYEIKVPLKSQQQF